MAEDDVMANAPAEDLHAENPPVEGALAEEPMEDASTDLAPLPDAGDTVNDVPMDDDLDYSEVGKEIKLTDDGGVIKKVITAGDGWETPEAGDEVTVHYVGTLEDGTQFDSSRDRNQPFVFPLGQGRVIKGWDTGVARMKRGEKALLICKPEYAYGPQGSPPKIPPNATLHFEVELLSWRSVKDISGDGGVIKTILAEGSGWEQCQELFEAKVSYIARVAGSETPFASCPPEEPVVFPTREGHLVPALATAVKTMKKGEKAALKVKPAYGFGEAGSEQYGVPPNADLEIELTLQGWNHVENVNPEGSVVKKTLVAVDSEYRKPNEGAKVTLRVTGTLLSDGGVFMRHGEGNELRFTTGEEQVVEGLEEAVMKMKRGERAIITITDPALGYGAAGAQPSQPQQEGAGAGEAQQEAQQQQQPQGPQLLAAVPPDSGLQFEVELVEFENAKESWEMSDAEKVEAARNKKDKGNAYYKAGKLAKAQHYWDRAVSAVQYDKPFSEDLKQASREVKRSCWLNLAALDIKRAHWKDALRNCNNVLDVDSQNVKALYRRAQAHMGLQDLFEAEQDLKKAQYAEPNNADVAALSRKLKAAMREQNKKEASLYSKMFKFSAAAAKTPAAAPAAEGGAPEVVVKEQEAAVEGGVAEAAPAAAAAVTVGPAEVTAA
ncbi:hypothetical protein Agub_g6687 [Astrephomene gubernaculifera]|uniref:peptidylprolyl isomerase n=1 Tax=Astrephomene gubernaculifera TaxID=47775 RepID=A0AAD3HM21_9CHLO|nr:hypothetical protein Agub_g6687 [Astrephomene gubernaculifera]